MVLEYLQYFSIGIEVLIALIGLGIFFKNKKGYGLGIFLTFAIYVFYDYAKLTSMNVDGNMLYILFFIASISMLVVAFNLYRSKKIKKEKEKSGEE